MFTVRNSGHSKVVAFVVILAMILMYTFAFAGTVFAASGSVMTTFSDDSTQNGNVTYTSKEDVYARVENFPANTLISVKVVAPGSGSDPDVQLGIALDVATTSEDGYAFLWIWDLTKFEDTTNSGGAYKLIVSTSTDFDGGETKSDNFKVEEEELPTTGEITVYKDVLTSTGGAVVDTSSSFAFSVSGPDDFTTTFAITDGQHMTFTLPFGTYIVEETGYGDYTPQTTQTSLSIDADNLTDEFTFENWQPGDTPPPTTGTVTIYKDVLTSTGAAVTDTSSSFAFSMTGDQFTTTFAITDGQHMSFTLPFGTYTVEETGYGDYTPQTTQTALSISLTTPTAMFTFENWQPEDTPPPPPDGFDIEVEKTVDDTRVYRNQSVTFTVTVTNNGPDDAYEIMIHDVIPEGLDIEDIQTSKGTFDDDYWYIGTMLDGDSETLTIEADVTAEVGTVITNTASWDGEDNDNTNNEDSASTTVIRRSPPDDDDEDEDIPEDPTPEGPAPEEPPVIIPEEVIATGDAPQTGDTTNPALLISLMLGSLVGLGALTRKKKVEETENN